MSFGFLTAGDPVEVTALSINVGAAFAALGFIVLAPFIGTALLRWRRRRGAMVDIVSPSIWVPTVVLSSLATDPIGGWGLGVAAVRALVFLYAIGQLYLFVMALRWLQRKRA